MCCERLLAGVDVEGVSAADPSEHVDLEPVPGAARAARKFVDAHAGVLTEDVRDAALLCVSELVTNGVLHARTPLRLGVTRGSTRVLVTVADSADETPQLPPTDHDRTSGRGLMLVDAVADAWGVRHDERGKTVWFTVTSGSGGSA